MDYGHIIGFLGQFAQKTASRKLSAIKTFLKHVDAPPILEDISPENLPQESSEIVPFNYLTQKECQRLKEAAKAKSARDTALITILLATGADITEALELRTEDFQRVSNQRISIRFKGSRDERLAVLDNEASLIVAAFLKTRVRTKNLFRLTRQGFWAGLKEYRKRIGRPDLSPRLFRNTFIVNFKGSSQELTTALGVNEGNAIKMILRRQITLRIQTPHIPLP